MRLKGIFLLLMILTGSHAEAGLISEQTDRMFDEMISNRTSGGYYRSSRRGVLSGGSIMTRSRILDLSLISFAPPHINAGCGGIDIFAGSFSFINSEQLIQLMRSIAANAAGYAFALALGEMSPEILSVIEWLQGIVNRLNLSQLNSCQLAQGLVNDVTGGIWSQTNRARTSASVVGSLSGWYSDYLDAMHQSGRGNVLSNLKRNNAEAFNQVVAGNVIYQAMSISGVVDAFGYGDRKTGIEELMSVTGTLIVDLAGSGAEGDSSEEQLVFTEKPPLIDFNDLMSAGDDFRETVYTCRDSDCLQVDTVRRSPGGFVNMTGRIEKLLCGAALDGGRDSVIWKYTHGADPDAELTDAQKALLDSSSVLATAVHDLGLSGSTELLHSFIHDYSKILSAMAVHEILSEIFRASRISLGQSTSRNVTRALNVLSRSEDNFNRQYREFLRHNGGTLEIERRLESMRSRIEQNIPLRQQ